MNPLNNLPPVQQLKKPETDPVARSIAKPDAFSKPGSIKGQPAKGTRFKALSVKKGPPKGKFGQRRKRDPRFVEYF